MKQYKGYTAEQNALINKHKFDKWFNIVPLDVVIAKAGRGVYMYALDLRDNTEFAIDDEHDIKRLIDSNVFAFGVEKPAKKYMVSGGGLVNPYEVDAPNIYTARMMGQVLVKGFMGHMPLNCFRVQNVHLF